MKSQHRGRITIPAPRPTRPTPEAVERIIQDVVANPRRRDPGETQEYIARLPLDVWELLMQIMERTGDSPDVSLAKAVRQYAGRPV